MCNVHKIILFPDGFQLQETLVKGTFTVYKCEPSSLFLDVKDEGLSTSKVPKLSQSILCCSKHRLNA